MELFNYLNIAHDKISAYFAKKTTKHSIADLTEIRTETFKLQAFGRILKRAGKKSSDEGQMIRLLGDNLKVSSKFIEDSIGELLYHSEMNENLENKSRLDEAELIFTILKVDIDQHIRWIAKSLEVISNLELKALYLKGLTKELKKLEEAVEDINPKLLEDGTHQLRRKLRWAVMHVIYPAGLFAYKEKSPKVTEFTGLVEVKGFKPIVIPFESINYLSTAVYELGEVKDEGLRANYSKTQSELNSSKPHIIELTKKILSDLKRNKALSLLNSEIKNQI